MSTNPYAAPAPAADDLTHRRMPVAAIELLRSMTWITVAAVVLTLFAIGFVIGAIASVWGAISMPASTFLPPPLEPDSSRLHFLRFTLIAALRSALYAAAFSYAARCVWDYRRVMRGIALESATWDDFSHAHRQLWSGIGIAALTIFVTNALASGVSVLIFAFH